VRIQAGATWGEVADFLREQHLAISSGDTRAVGVGGLTLGGGIGWMARKHGLAIDSLLSAQIVTASGEILRASAIQNRDLFWALRGGGGNFGVVTCFEFVAQPVSKVFAGSIVYGSEDLASIVRGWRDVMRSAAEDLTTSLVSMPPFAGNPAAVMILCCYAGTTASTGARHIKIPPASFSPRGEVLSQAAHTALGTVGGLAALNVVVRAILRQQGMPFCRAGIWAVVFAMVLVPTGHGRRGQGEHQRYNQDHKIKLPHASASCVRVKGFI
jgi:FAD/FMN-containing dehydrogenase